jgi:hypothetical protein
LLNRPQINLRTGTAVDLFELNFGQGALPAGWEQPLS